MIRTALPVHVLSSFGGALLVLNSCQEEPRPVAVTGLQMRANYVEVPVSPPVEPPRAPPAPSKEDRGTSFQREIETDGTPANLMLQGLKRHGLWKTAILDLGRLDAGVDKMSLMVSDDWDNLLKGDKKKFTRELWALWSTANEGHQPRHEASNVEIRNREGVIVAAVFFGNVSIKD